jgi:hypothetical protein
MGHGPPGRPQRRPTPAAPAPAARRRPRPGSRSPAPQHPSTPATAPTRNVLPSEYGGSVPALTAARCPCGSSLRPVLAQLLTNIPLISPDMGVRRGAATSAPASAARPVSRNPAGRAPAGPREPAPDPHHATFSQAKPTCREPRNSRRPGKRLKVKLGHWPRSALPGLPGTVVSVRADMADHDGRGGRAPQAREESRGLSAGPQSDGDPVMEDGAPPLRASALSGPDVHQCLVPAEEPLGVLDRCFPRSGCDLRPD